MADTTNLTLPLIAAAQAQKHVTVNEALTRLDGLTQLILISRTIAVPPVATDGAAYGVPVGGTSDWTGHDGEIAIFSNGGWVFATPQAGWHAFIAEESMPAMYDGTDWVTGAIAVSGAGAVSRFEVAEITHNVAAGSSSVTGPIIPSNSLVFGVTGRVTADITGSATSYELGVSGSSNRYGSGLGLITGSFAQGLTGAPVAYYSDTNLELTATGGTFDGGGSITLVAHIFRMTPPA